MLAFSPLFSLFCSGLLFSFTLIGFGGDRFDGLRQVEERTRTEGMEGISYRRSAHDHFCADLVDHDHFGHANDHSCREKKDLDDS